MGKISNTDKSIIVNKVINDLDQLVQECQVWDAMYRRTHDELHIILSKSLQIYYDIKGSKVEKEAILLMRADVKKFTPNLPTRIRILPLIVRYIFKCNRQRVYSYTRMLEKALKANVKPEELDAWIKSKGDYEDVLVTTLGASQASLDKRKALDKKILDVEFYLESLNQNPIGLIPGSELVPHTETGEYTLLIAKTMPSGFYRVLAPIPNSDGYMSETAIAKIAKCLITFPEREIFMESHIGNTSANHDVNTLDSLFISKEEVINVANAHSDQQFEFYSANVIDCPIDASNDASVDVNNVLKKI